jgi:hypothetical protein
MKYWFTAELSFINEDEQEQFTINNIYHNWEHWNEDNSVFTFN